MSKNLGANYTIRRMVLVCMLGGCFGIHYLMWLYEGSSLTKDMNFYL